MGWSFAEARADYATCVSAKRRPVRCWLFAVAAAACKVRDQTRANNNRNKRNKRNRIAIRIQRKPDFREPLFCVTGKLYAYGSRFGEK